MAKSTTQANTDTAKQSDAPVNIEAAEPTIQDGASMVMDFVLRHPGAMMPTYATDGSGAFDLYAPQGGRLRPLDSATIDIGIGVEIPKGFSMLILSRSGHGRKNEMRLANCVGFIDSDYRGNLMVTLKSDNRFAEFTWEAGDRIAQACLVATPKVIFRQVDALSETARGEGGHGSTGA